MVTVHWNGKMGFTGTGPSGNSVFMDASEEAGGDNQGPSPLETFLAALAGCSAMDVITILRKKQQVVTGYRVEVEGERTPYGSPWPRPYTALTIRHIVTGENVDPAAVQRAIQLTDEKYCSVIATLREQPEIKSEWRIE